MSLKFIIILFLPVCVLSQSAGGSKYERWWALGHPFAAIKVKLISKKCYQIYNKDLGGKLDNFSNGGKLDAFRHVFFMAAFSQKVKTKKLRKLGCAHEKANYKQFLKLKTEFNESPDSLSTIMDLQNNELAFKNAAETKKLSLPELEKYVIDKIKTGNAFIMKRKKNGTYLDCVNNVIDLNLFKGKWSVPKCLVRSDENYMD